MKISNQKVSVVIPAYNHEKYIREAIESVQSQTHRNMEIIIVNDGSSDNTGEICKKKAKMDSRIIVYEQSNKGAYNAINYGVTLATCSYLAVLNSDDIFLPDKIRRCLEIVREDPSIGFVAGKIVLMNEAGNILETGVEVDWLNRAYLFMEKTGCLSLSVLNENFIATTSNMFFARDCWKKVGGFMQLRYCHDLEFLMTVFRNEVYKIDTSDHIRYRVHTGNTIKENIDRVRVEIAAVIAASMIEYDMDLIGEPNSISISFLKEFLKNKNLSDMIVLQIMNFLRMEDKKAFFEYISREEVKDLYATFF